MSTWIDLTDFLQWKGNLTGIQRIQYNMSKLFIESEKDVKFFVYSEHEKSFNEVNFSPDEIVKSGIASPLSVGSQTRGYVPTAAVFAAKVRRRLVGNHRSQRPNPHRDVTAPFAENDTVLIMGGVWVGDFIGDLGVVKKRQHFKLVHFAFDMIPSLFPGFVVEWLPDAFTEYQKQVFSIAEGIIAISESTAKDVRSFIKSHGIENTPTITVVRIGETVDELVPKGQKKRENLSPGFLLSVSTIEARKNHLALFYMLKEADRRGIQLPKIVVVGRNGWQTDDFRYIVQHDPIAREGLIIINDADDETLVWLYNNCLFTIFPSFYEGWGMPIAESLAYGKLCLSSNTSSMPEIAGDLIDYFSPYDTGELLDTVTKYLNPSTLKKKESQIQEQYHPTSWRDMYVEVVSFIEQKISN